LGEVGCAVGGATVLLLASEVFYVEDVATLPPVRFGSHGNKISEHGADFGLFMKV
jgi:hypothetical protein